MKRYRTVLLPRAVSVHIMDFLQEVMKGLCADHLHTFLLDVDVFSGQRIRNLLTDESVTLIELFDILELVFDSIGDEVCIDLEECLRFTEDAVKWDEQIARFAVGVIVAGLTERV